VGAVKGMKLRGTSNEWLATAREVGRVGREAGSGYLALAFMHIKVIGFCGNQYLYR